MKQLIRLTEGDLHRIINKSIKSALNEKRYDWRNLRAQYYKNRDNTMNPEYKNFIHAVTNTKSFKASVDFCQKAYKDLDNIWEMMTQEGLVDPNEQMTQNSASYKFYEAKEKIKEIGETIKEIISEADFPE